MKLSLSGTSGNKYNTYFVIAFIFTIKLLSILYLGYLARCLENFLPSGLASMAGDASSYITPIDNYINEGNYYFESAKAGRMPYLGLVYYPFRLLFTKSVALSIVVILQVLMASIAVFYTAKLCADLFKSQAAFRVFIFLSLISLYITTYDSNILSESFGISFLCLFAYHYYKYLTKGRSNKQLAFTGLFFALSLLFKPYFSLLFFIIGVELLWHHRHLKFSMYYKKVITSCVIVSLPLILLDAPWTIRNYKLLNKFIPFQQDIYAGYPFPPASQAYIEFIRSIGESYVYWDSRSAGCYFEPHEGLPCNYKFPKRIFSASLTMADIEEARNLYLNFKKSPGDSIEKLTIRKFNMLSETYKRDHAFSYYFLVPVIRCKIFLLHSGSYYLPVKKDSACYHSYQWGLKILQSLLYYLALTAGFLGTLLMLFRFQKTFIIFTIPVYLILFFPIFLRATEFRYFHPSHPFLLIGLTYILFLSFNYLRKFLLQIKQH